MPRRIDVELTSERNDGTWTWRVAGAREPRGVLDGTLLHSGVKVGDVVRVEAEFDIDGISVLAIIPPKETRSGGERLELLTTAHDEPLVSATLAGPGRERRQDRPDRPDRQDRRGSSDRTDRAGRPDRRPDDGRDRRPASDRPAGGRLQDRRGGADRDRSGREGEGADSTRRRRERTNRRDRTEGTGSGTGPQGVQRSTAPRTRTRPPAEPSRPKPKRLRAGRAHRKVVLDSLPPEQRPVAEQVLQGGIPAVRQAIEKQNATSTAEGKPEIKAAPLLALAEELLPRLRTAEWRDRAEAALGDVDELDLRDLRSVVVAADVAARDDETRQLAASLRTALARRVDEEQRNWLHEITGALNDGRVVRALRLSSRPPKAGSIFPRDVASRLTDSTAASLTAEASADRWSAVLEALAFAPVRRAVTPQSVPANPSAELQATIQRFASRLPDVAAAFGIEAPAEPPPRTRRRPPPRPKAAGRPATPAPSNAAAEPAPPASESEPATDAIQPADPPPPPAAATTGTTEAPDQRAPGTGADKVRDTEPEADPEPETLRSR